MSDALKNRLREFYSDLLQVEAGVIGLIATADQPREEIVHELNATQDRLAGLQRSFSGIRLHELGVLASNDRSPGLAEGLDAPQAASHELNRPEVTPG